MSVVLYLSDDRKWWNTNDADGFFVARTHMGDRIAFLHEGRILFHGTTAEARAAREPLLQNFLQGGGYA
jgi:hypothetical protein